MPGFRIGDLPRNMREELFNLHATSVDPDANERAFFRKVVPTREVDISRLDNPADTGAITDLKGYAMPRRRRTLGASNPHGCNIGSIEAKIAAVRREYKPVKRFKPLFDHVLNLALDSAKHGYCQRAGREIRHAKKVAGYR